jgi:hypothetical protein
LTSRYRLFFSAFILSIITILPAYSQENEEIEPLKVDYYSLGDQCFSISAGLYIPLFFLDLTPDDGNDAAAVTNLTVGGTGSLMYEAYLNNNIKLGMEVGGMFAYSPNMNPFFMVPITARIGYEFHFGQFSMPIYLGTGINIITYQDYSNVQLLFKPGISLFWNFNSSWAFGANLVYWIAPEIIFEDPDQNRIGNFMDFTISAQYHF